MTPDEPCSADIDDCDGERHVCGDCGGDGWTEDDDGVNGVEDVMCSTCQGKGGWPCPSAANIR